MATFWEARISESIILLIVFQGRVPSLTDHAYGRVGDAAGSRSQGGALGVVAGGETLGEACRGPVNYGLLQQASFT